MKTFLIIVNSLCVLFWVSELISLIAGIQPSNYTIGCGFFLAMLCFVNLLINATRMD